MTKALGELASSQATHEYVKTEIIEKYDNAYLEAAGFNKTEITEVKETLSHLATAAKDDRDALMKKAMEKADAATKDITKKNNTPES